MVDAWLLQGVALDIVEVDAVPPPQRTDVMQADVVPVSRRDGSTHVAVSAIANMGASLEAMFRIKSSALRLGGILALSHKAGDRSAEYVNAAFVPASVLLALPPSLLAVFVCIAPPSPS